MKLLLHTCCGPCFLGTWQELKNKEFDIVNLFYNPNIQPRSEHERRLLSFKKAIKGKSRDFIEKSYNPQEHLNAISDKEENRQERCKKCYFLRLSETAKIAKENKINLFSTTLLVSPYQNQSELLVIGKELARKYNIEFLPADFRGHFREGQKIAREQNLYMQKYCGCLFSKAEAKNSYDKANNLVK